MMALNVNILLKNAEPQSSDAYDFKKGSGQALHVANIKKGVSRLPARLQ